MWFSVANVERHLIIINKFSYRSILFFFIEPQNWINPKNLKLRQCMTLEHGYQLLAICIFLHFDIRAIWIGFIQSMSTWAKPHKLQFNQWFQRFSENQISIIVMKTDVARKCFWWILNCLRIRSKLNSTLTKVSLIQFMNRTAAPIFHLLHSERPVMWQKRWKQTW